MVNKYDPRLARLTTRLSEEDESYPFGLYVPDTRIDKFLRDLRSRYEKEELIIRSVSKVEKHLREGDTVEADFNFLYYDYRIVKHARGVVAAVEDEHYDVEMNWRKVVVDFEKGFKTAVFDNEIVVYGKRRFLRSAKRYPLTRGDCFQLKKGDLVRYIGDVKLRHSSSGIEKKTRGKVYNRIGMDAEVIFEGLQSIVARIPCRDLNLIRPNNINFEKLYHECFGEEGREVEDEV